MQLAAAYSALLNGGTYYQPTIVESRTKNGEKVINEPKVVKDNVVSPQVSEEMKAILHEQQKANNTKATKDGYRLGTKSGTAEVPDGQGGYKEDVYNGAYVGYIEGQELEYVLVTRLDEPRKLSGLFASFDAGVLWAEISNDIIDTLALPPM